MNHGSIDLVRARGRQRDAGLLRGGVALNMERLGICRSLFTRIDLWILAGRVALWGCRGGVGIGCLQALD